MDSMNKTVMANRLKVVKRKGNQPKSFIKEYGAVRNSIPVKVSRRAGGT